MMGLNPSYIFKSFLLYLQNLIFFSLFLLQYLQNRQASWKAEEERIEREKPDPDCPAGHRKLSDGDRREILGQMKERYKSLTLQANSFPVRNDTMRVQKMKAEIEREMANLEEKICQYERPKVFVKIED